MADSNRVMGNDGCMVDNGSGHNDATWSWGSGASSQDARDKDLYSILIICYRLKVLKRFFFVNLQA